MEEAAAAQQVARKRAAAAEAAETEWRGERAMLDKRKADKESLDETQASHSSLGSPQKTNWSKLKHAPGAAGPSAAGGSLSNVLKHARAAAENGSAAFIGPDDGYPRVARGSLGTSLSAPHL
jgi:hypothetical protein